MVSDTELLKLVLKATQHKKLKWKRIEGTERYEAAADRFPYIIEYQRPILQNGKTSATPVIRVIVAGVLITFTDGTQQAEIIEDILATAFQDWADHVRIMQENRVEAAERLVKLIGDP